MRRVEVGCDRCGAAIVDGDGAGVLVIAAGPRSLPWPTALETGRPTVDLCAACLEGLTDWLRSPAPPERGWSGAGAGAVKDADGWARAAGKGGVQ